MPLRGEFGGGFGEDFCVEVDVGFGGGGADEGHVVEGSEEDAAVEGVEVKEAFEFEIGGSGGPTSVARGLRSEGVFGAGAEARDVPGQAARADLRGDSVGEAVR